MTDPNDTGFDVPTDPTEVSLPPTVGDRLAAQYGAVSVGTAADWLDALFEAIEPTGGGSLDASDLCTTDDSPHVIASADGTQAYRCVLDPMLVPFLTGDPGTVRSTCPTSDEAVAVDIADGTVDVTPETAVFSVGVDPEPTVDPPYTPAETYGHVCPYANVFADEEAYDAWAAKTAAATTALPLEDAVAVVAGLARRIQGR